MVADCFLEDRDVYCPLTLFCMISSLTSVFLLGMMAGPMLSKLQSGYIPFTYDLEMSDILAPMIAIGMFHCILMVGCIIYLTMAVLRCLFNYRFPLIGQSAKEQTKIDNYKRKDIPAATKVSEILDELEGAKKNKEKPVNAVKATEESVDNPFKLQANAKRLEEHAKNMQISEKYERNAQKPTETVCETAGAEKGKIVIRKETDIANKDEQHEKEITAEMNEKQTAAKEEKKKQKTVEKAKKEQETKKDGRIQITVKEARSEIGET